MSVDKDDWIYRYYKDGSREKLFHMYCDKCGKDKGYILNYTVNGSKASDRSCKDCRSKDVAIKNIGHVPWNKGKHCSENTKNKLREINLGHPPTNKGVNLSEYVKKKISCTLRGIDYKDFDDFSWKKEIQRKQDFNIDLRNKCFERDQYTCDVCCKKGVTLNAHHKNSYNNFPEKLNDLDNLVTLCSYCHKVYHKLNGNGIKRPNTEEQYLEFKENYYGREQMDDTIDKSGWNSCISNEEEGITSDPIVVT